MKIAEWVLAALLICAPALAKKEPRTVGGSSYKIFTGEVKELDKEKGTLAVQVQKKLYKMKLGSDVQYKIGKETVDSSKLDMGQTVKVKTEVANKEYTPLTIEILE